MSATALPFLSVIVPAHDGGRVLDRTLSALRSSTLARDHWELVVVDDASTDETATIAARFADVVLRLPGKPHGPAYARNRGSEACRGEVLVFIDADVAVHLETLSRFAEIFARDDVPAAAFGSYDRTPSSLGIVSQYRNLLHHHVHQNAGGAAETFWAGCGAVRREVFAEVGGFDESRYQQPQIEDIELGRRIRRMGHTILLVPEIQGTHLKHWSFRDVVKTDFYSRGVPWMRLILAEGRTAGSTALNLRGRERLCTALIGIAGLMILAAVALRSVFPLIAAAASIATVLMLNRDFYRLLYVQRGIGLAVGGATLHLTYYALNVASAVTGWILHHLGSRGEAPTAAGEESGGGPTRPSPMTPRSGVPRTDDTTPRQKLQAL